MNHDSSALEKGHTSAPARQEADPAADPTAGAPPAGPSGGPPTNYKPALVNLVKLGTLLVLTFWVVALWLFGSYVSRGKEEGVGKTGLSVGGGADRVGLVAGCSTG